MNNLTFAIAETNRQNTTKIICETISDRIITIFIVAFVMQVFKNLILTSFLKTKYEPHIVSRITFTYDIVSILVFVAGCLAIIAI